MVGSVTDQVMQTAAIPVLVVRPAKSKGRSGNGAVKSLAL